MHYNQRHTQCIYSVSHLFPYQQVMDFQLTDLQYHIQDFSLLSLYRYLTVDYAFKSLHNFFQEAIETYQSEEGQEEEGNEDDDEDDSDDDRMCDVGDGFSLPSEIYKSLYQYQLDGILWFWRLFKKGMGGILADDMG